MSFSVMPSEKVGTASDFLFRYPQWWATPISGVRDNCSDLLPPPAGTVQSGLASSFLLPEMPGLRWASKWLLATGVCARDAWSGVG